MTGIDQTKNMSQSEVSELIKMLCQASDKFRLIPEATQQQILDRAINESEFYGLSYKFVYTHLSRYMARNPQIKAQLSQVDKDTEEERERRNQEFLKANPDYNVDKTIAKFKQQIESVGKPQRHSRTSDIAATRSEGPTPTDQYLQRRKSDPRYQEIEKDLLSQQQSKRF